LLIASFKFKPVLADVLKQVTNPLSSENFFKSRKSLALFGSNKSTLFSTKIQGNSDPSKNFSVSSTVFFHLNVL